MIIKRWNGSAFVEEFPKTKAQLIFNNGNSTSVFDSNDKIKPAYLPDSVFDSLIFYGTTSGAVGSAPSRLVLSEALIAAKNAAATAGRSIVGYYWVINTAGTITGLTGIQDTITSQEYATLQFRPQDAGSSGTVNTSSGSLEVGDWFVIESVTGAGTSGVPYVFTAAVINNSYELATTDVDGVVRLSSRTTYAALSGNNVVTEGVLKTVIDNASFAASSHTHGDINNNGTITATAVTPGDTDYLLISDTSASGAIERGVLIGTGTTTYLRNDGTWGTPAGTYTLPAATSTVRGGIELFSDTVQSVAANAVSSTASRTYGVQVNSDGQAVVNVPWSDTNTTYSKATSTVLGLVEIFDNTVQSVAANAVSTTASRTYGIQLNSNDQMVVNVPWTDTIYTLPSATDSVLGGIKLGSGTQQTTAANAVTSTASRSYALQVNASGQGLINVPWTDTTYSAGEGITLSSTTFRMTYPLYVQTATPTTSVTGTIWYDIN